VSKALTALTIGEVADLLGITTKAIRHYHEQGLIAEPERSESGYRLYGAQELHRLSTILRLQGLGLTLRQIRFIVDTDQPDALLRDILLQRQQQIADEVAALQRQQERIAAFLDSDTSVAGWEDGKAPYSASAVLHTTMKPHGSGLADIIVATERDVLHQIDQYRWSEGYEVFWQTVAQRMIKMLLPHEHQVIMWLSRFLALAELPPDDRQVQYWLAEFRKSDARYIMAKALDVPTQDQLSPKEQVRLQQLIPMLLLEHSSDAQRAFVRVLFSE
jgi:DNA-binding transcriptional MerR regulator